MSRTSAVRRPLLVSAVVVAFLLALTPTVRPAHAATVTVMVSAHPDRSSAMGLSAAPQAGLLYIFTSPDTGVSKVSFYLDDPNRLKAAYHVETWAPFTFTGDTAAGSNPWDSTTVPNGQHTITAAVVSGGATQFVTSTFTVNNIATPPPQPAPYALQVSAHSDRSAGAALEGATVRGTEYVSVPSTKGITRVVFFLDDAARVKTPYQVEGSAPWDFRGTSAGGAVPWQTSGVSDGTHVISADVTTPTGVSHLDAAFTVSNGAPSSGADYTYADIASVPTGTTEAESLTIGDKVYLFGGFDIHQTCCTSTDRSWLYDPAANAWSGLPSLPAPGISHAGMATDGTRYVYYAGGYADDPTGVQGVNATTLAYRYDLTTGTYTSLPPLPQPRTAGGMAWVAGKLYYFGGNGIDRTVDSANTWMLDVAGGSTTWQPRAPMPNGRDHPGWGVIDGTVYVVGGEHGTDATKAQAELDRYDPVTNTWSTLTPMPFPRSHLMDSTFVLDGKLYAVGGWTTSVVSAAVLSYDPVTNAWTAHTDVPEARTSATAKGLSGGRFLFCCGSAGTSTSTGWLATPRH